jgi:hypothetical protein
MLNTSRGFQGRGQAELAAGRPDNAFADVQTILALARAAGSDPFLISLLFERSIFFQASQVISDGLERHAWTDAQLADLSSELSRIDLLARLSSGLRVERVNVLQFADSRAGMLRILLQGTPDTGKVTLHNEALRAAATLWPSGWLNEDKAAYIGSIQRYIDAVKQPKELPSTLGDIEASLTTRTVWNKIKNPILSSVLPAILGVAKTIVATQTTLRSLATACAVERYRMAHGRLPATVEDLVPAFLPSAPTDPLTGKPLCYNPSEGSSYLIYGTGWDQTDNAASGVTENTLSRKTMDQADWGVLVKL